jgi:hypothetical protein
VNNSKSYNQILFITTLSVYLGLVLVGASPQVLAQAALTSKFDIKDQIEKQDDLDRNPEDVAQDFLSEYEKLVAELAQQEGFLNGNEHRSSDVSQDVRLGIVFDKLPNVFRSADLFLGSKSDDLVVKLKLNLKISGQTSASFLSQATNSFSQLLKVSKNIPEKIIFQSTTVTSADNQVIISTRLPRGSIDSLLKQ